MLKKLKEILFGKPPLEMDHEFFGKILFMGGDIPDKDAYWECELKVLGHQKPIGVLIPAGLEGPSPDQVVFYKQITSDLDELFKQCWPIFEPDFEQWTGRKFSGQWRNEFEIDGISLPKDGDRNNEWDVCYFVDQAGHYFTAKFENGRPKHNEIDG